MSFPFVLILVFVLVIGIVAYKSRVAGTGFVRSGNGRRLWQQQPVYRDHRPAVKRTDFRAVSIQSGSDCCQAASRLNGKRGFPNQIPRLPLSQCDAEKCTCTYVQHRDRRVSDDRRDMVAGLAAIGISGDDRRACPERRNINKEDGLDAFNFASD